MIADSHDGLDGKSYDVCVVGAGPVGIALALGLQALGRSVLVLESGGLAAEPSIQELASADIAYPEKHDSMAFATSRRLGGTSNLWGGRCIPYDPVDFTSRPGVVDVEWPITLDEIAPYYARACEITASGSPVYVDPDPALGDPPPEFAVDRIERWSNSPRLGRVHRKALADSDLIDVRLHSVVTDIAFDDTGAVESIELVRPNGEGRRRLPVRNLVIAAGGVETTRMLLAVQRRDPTRFGGPDGPLGRYYMGHLTGVIADIVMANAAMDNAFDFYIDRYGTYVRRRFVPSDALQARLGVMNMALWPVVPSISDAGHSSAILSAIYLALAFGPMGRRIIPEALRVRHVPDPAPSPWPHVGNVAGNLATAVPFLLDFLRRRHLTKARIPGFYVRNPAFRYGLCFHSEQWPNPENRITLTNESDRLGLPKAHIAYRFHDRDAASILTTHDAFAEWLKRSGLGRLEHRLPPEARAAAILDESKHGTHQIGTTRMARSARDGVVDRDLRTFGSRNLFIASSSVLPTSSQANPTLTAVALALRLAETLAAETRA